jgi:multidrug efflux pump subunit AcrB
MNALVVVALRRPLTFVVMSILIVLFGVMAIFKTPTDIFPNIRIPVVAVVWTYAGLLPQDMSGRIVYYYERALTATVDNIEHIESQSLYGRGIVKIFFQPGTDVAAAQAQITSISQTVLNQMPAGTTPPQILSYNASSVPVLDLQVSAPGMTSAQVYDMASNLIRPQLVSVPGAAIPSPYGGATLTVEVDLDQNKLLAHGLSAQDVARALATQNVVLPAGDQKVGAIDFMVATNSTPIKIRTFNNLPIKTVGNATVYLRDVAYVHAGSQPQMNAVLVKGHQAVLIEILKSGDASTLSIVDGIKAQIPQILKTLPAGVQITPLNDASSFVRDSVEEVVQEMITAALLTGTIVLLFLGSWRSTLIVATSIPLAILCSVLGLSWMGQTINVMTLGGLALAVGILVDDATVMIENIDAHLEHGAELEAGIIEAANQIVVPTFVATLCICIVWLPLFQLSGISGYLFLPMAEAIIFAMIASFILSRTLVPTMAAYLLRGQVEKHKHGPASNPGPFVRFQRGFERRFERFRQAYKGVLSGIVAVRGRFIIGFLGASVASLLLITFLGQDFFPGIKSGELDMHMRAPIGTRLEQASKLAVLVNQSVRDILHGQVSNIVDNCGLPVSGTNEAYNATGTIGPQDCDVTISLKNQASPVDQYRSELRRELPRLVNLQTPQDQLASMNDLETVPVDKGNGDPGGHAIQLLGALSRITQTGSALLNSHYNILPVIDIYATNQGRDLGAVNDAVLRVVNDMKSSLPHGATIQVQGQAETMASAYAQLLGGLALSVLLVYLVIVVNFQSWIDPFIIVSALPGALAGIVWSLFLTDTTLSVPALTGAIMCMGTATANSILVVSFARERLAEHGDAVRAAVEAGYGRIRPVLMTALAMMIGMLPMSFSNSQNAPLGRAVIGGLLVATFATLLFVPCVFAVLHNKKDTARPAHEAR